MKDGKTPTTDMNALASKSVEQRGPMKNSEVLPKNMSASSWSDTELNKKLADYAQKNVNTAFGFAQRLTQAKDLSDLVRIQTEFFHMQLKSSTEQAKDLGETATKAVSGSLKGPGKPSG